jgi:hypothetical protein
MHLTSSPAWSIASLPSAAALWLTIGWILAGLRALAVCAVLFGIWLVAFRCRLQVYCEVLRRLDERQSSQPGLACAGRSSTRA